MGMALTGKVAPYKLNFGPFPPEIYHAPFPTPGTSVAAALRGVSALFKSDIDPRRVAAIIIEPVQGEGGFYVAPREFMVGLRHLCDEHGILLIADEVQCGFGRTGKWFAMEHFGVAADLVTTAKSLAGGFPLAAVTGRAEVMDAAPPGGLGGTYAGSPMGIAAALAVLAVMREEGLLARSVSLGARLVAFLEALRGSVPQISDIRGLGSMIALEFTRVGSDEPDAQFAKRVQVEAMQRGLILLSCGTGANVLRFLYPLTIGDALFDEALALFKEAIGAAQL
jgi:4-aminobutyrate aminotransferase